MGTGEFNAGGNPAIDWHPIQGGVEIFLVASCYGKRDKLRPDGPLGSYADFTLQVWLVSVHVIFWSVFHFILVFYIFRLYSETTRQKVHKTCLGR